MKYSDLGCPYFGSCGSCVYENYEISLKQKTKNLKEEFADFYDKEFEIFQSQKKHFRNRAEFKIYIEENVANFAMSGKESKFVKIKNCQIVDNKIYALMDDLINQINLDEALKNRLFGVEFITTKDEILTILLYHKNIDEISQNLAKLKEKLNINLIARSRKKRLVFGNEILKEKLLINGENFYYRFSEGSFIQPNTKINEKMIEFALSCIKDSKKCDYLEMYCGYGNFTMPLTKSFQKSLATEISKQSIKNAKVNCTLNDIQNCEFVRISSEELMDGFYQKREFKRLKDINLKDYNFSHILVDPPRVGLDEKVINFIKNFDNIIYISCNYATLKRDLQTLCKTHKIARFGLFDQFAYTNHLECGILLKIK